MQFEFEIALSESYYVIRGSESTYISGSYRTVLGVADGTELARTCGIRRNFDDRVC